MCVAVVYVCVQLCICVYASRNLFFVCLGLCVKVCKVCAGVTGKLIYRCFELEFFLGGVMVLLRPIAIHTEIDFHNIHSTCVYRASKN